MLCPACNSASPDDVRFCLHCGHYLGERDEQTVVRNAGKDARAPSRPGTTIFASPPIQSLAYEAPRERRWPYWIALFVLLCFGLVGLGMLAAVLWMNDENKAATANSNTSARVFTTPTPRPPATPTPTIEPTPVRSAPVVEASEPPEPDATPARVAVDAVVLTWSGWLNDGQQMAWTVPAGSYGVEFTASGSGGTIELAGSDCFKTKAMARLRQRCNLPVAGSLVITNPTIFAAGPAISVTVKVVRLRE